MTLLADLPTVVRWAVVAVGVGVLAVSWYLARGERLPDGERQVFRAVNDQSHAFYKVVWPVMQLGSLAGGIGVAVVAGLLTGELAVALVAGATVVVTWLVAKAVKSLVGRGRPSAYLEDSVRREQASGLGFVSGHAAVAFGLATALAPVLPPWGEVLALLLATGIGAARLYVGAHLPLDVVGGAGIGVATGTVMAIVFHGAMG